MGTVCVSAAASITVHVWDCWYTIVNVLQMEEKENNRRTKVKNQSKSIRYLILLLILYRNSR